MVLVAMMPMMAMFMYSRLIDEALARCSQQRADASIYRKDVFSPFLERMCFFFSLERIFSLSRKDSFSFTKGPVSPCPTDPCKAEKIPHEHYCFPLGNRVGPLNGLLAKNVLMLCLLCSRGTCVLTEYTRVHSRLPPKPPGLASGTPQNIYPAIF